MTLEAQSGWLGELARTDRPHVVVDSDGTLRHVGLAAFGRLGRAPADTSELLDLLLPPSAGGDRRAALDFIRGAVGSITLGGMASPRITLSARRLREQLRIVQWVDDAAGGPGRDVGAADLLEEVLDEVAHGMIIYERDAEGQDAVRLFNRAAEALLETPPGFLRRGLTREEIVRFCVERGDHGPPAARDDLGKGDECTLTAVRPSGRFVEVRARQRRDGRGSVTLTFDVSEDVARMDRLVEAEERYRLIAENAPTGILKLDGSGRIAFANDAAVSLLGGPIDTIDLRRQLVPADGRSLDEHFAGSASFDAEIRRGEDVSYVMVSVAPSLRVLGGRVVTLADFTALRLANRQIEHLAEHDPLTGLGNRSRFARRWAEIEAAAPQDRAAHLVCIDLDRFKLVNDDHGHHVGDLLLSAVAERLKAAVNERGEIFRLGGDEFAVIVAGAARDVAIEIAEEVVGQMSRSFRLEGIFASIGCSAGIASMPEDGSSGIEIQRAADVALYSVKRNGRNGFACYDPAQSEMSEERRLASDLALALAHDEMELYFQPTFDLSTGRVVRLETLIRWFSPRRDMFVSPGIFLPAAEDAGLIALVDLWVLRNAAAQAKAFLAAGVTRPCLSVNISPTTLSRPGVAERMIGTIHSAGIDPSLIEIEMTRSPLEKDMAAVRRTLDAVRAAGLTVALDDFGAAGSGLAILQALPFDRVKLHGSIIEGVGRDDDASAIAAAVLSICRRLGRRLTAEGIETEQQREALKAIGSIDGQGSLLAEPEPMEAALYRLLRQEGRPSNETQRSHAGPRSLQASISA